MAVITKVYVRISHSVAGLPLCAKVELHPGVSWVGDTMAVRTVSRAVPTGGVWGGCDTPPIIAHVGNFR